MKKYSAFLQIFMALIMVSASLQRTACSLDTRNKLVSTARTTIVSPASSTRCEHISSMDATSGKIYVWGGMINTSNMVGSYPKDGGIYDPVGDSWATWTSAGAAGAPAARSEIPFWYLGFEQEPGYDGSQIRWNPLSDRRRD